MATQWRTIYLDAGVLINWDSAPGTKWSALLAQIAAAGYNCLILAFYLDTTGPVDSALTWQEYSNSQGNLPGGVPLVRPPGLKILVTAGGSTVSLAKTAVDPTVWGTAVGKWAATYGMDGIDFDLENASPGDANWGGPWTPNSAGVNTGYVDFIGKVTIAAYNAYQQQTGRPPIITHAPQAPYFGTALNTWTGTISKGYTDVEKQYGKYITAYNVQFYNQGCAGSLCCYTTPAGLMTTSAGDCSGMPGTSVAEIIAAGIPASKLIIGKPIKSTDGSNGFFPDLSTAITLAPNAGIMGWQWSSDADSCKALFGAPCSTLPAPGPGQTPVPGPAASCNPACTVGSALPTCDTTQTPPVCIAAKPGPAADTGKKNTPASLVLIIFIILMVVLGVIFVLKGYTPIAKSHLATVSGRNDL